MAGTQDSMGQGAEMAQIFNLPDIMLAVMKPFVDFDNGWKIFENKECNNFYDRFPQYRMSEKARSISGLTRSCKAINYWFNKLLLQQQLVGVYYAGPANLSPGEFGPIFFVHADHLGKEKSSPLKCNSVQVTAQVPSQAWSMISETVVLTPLQFRSWLLFLRSFKLSRRLSSLETRFVASGRQAKGQYPASFGGEEILIPSGAQEACKKQLLNLSVDENDAVDWDGVPITNPNLLAFLDNGLAEAQSLNNALLRRSMRISSMDGTIPWFSRKTATVTAKETRIIQQRLRAIHNVEDEPCPLLSESISALCQTALIRWLKSPVHDMMWQRRGEIDCEGCNCPCVVLESAGIEMIGENHGTVFSLPIPKPFGKSIPNKVYRQLGHAVLVSHLVQDCIVAISSDAALTFCDMGELEKGLREFAKRFGEKDKVLAKMISDDHETVRALIRSRCRLTRPIKLGGRKVYATYEGPDQEHRVMLNDHDLCLGHIPGRDFEVIV